MHIQTLKAVATIRNLNQSDLARAAGVSRQRISQWLHHAPVDGFVNIQTKHLMSIAAALGILPGVLLRPLPLLCDEQGLQGETARLLWDKLYPDLTSLLVAALDRQPQALARVVQVYGLFASAKLFGGRVWRDFDTYKQFIHPVRRKELECLWKYRQTQTKH
jgi:transcriptional regulator with XRE-family HTH domain